jgi:tetratricopeptide (TPR) repeat protein
MPTEEAAYDPLLAERAAALGADLWELHDVLQPMRVTHASLALAEDACIRLDTRYAELPPLVLLPELRRQTHHVVGWLREPQPVTFRQRLCSLAGCLAGLRAWLFFDMADYQAAAAWFSTGVSAAKEADDLDLCGWLLGGQSLIPIEQDDYPAAAALLGEAQAAVGRAASHTTRGWLDVLEGRALAGMGDARGFAAAQQRAHKRLQRTSPTERRHGMDFADERLDLTYYEGLSHLLLGQPEEAGATFQAALDNLPTSRVKARSVLLLSLGLAAARAREFDEAAAQASEALSIAEEQPIRRVWQRAQEVRGALAPAAGTEPVRDLDEHMRAFAGALERATA